MVSMASMALIRTNGWTSGDTFCCFWERNKVFLLLLLLVASSATPAIRRPRRAKQSDLSRPLVEHTSIHAMFSHGKWAHNFYSTHDGVVKSPMLNVEWTVDAVHDEVGSPLAAASLLGDQNDGAALRCATYKHQLAWPGV